LNYFFELLKGHDIIGVRQTEMHSTEPLVSGLSRLEVEIATTKLKKYKSPGSNQIPTELI
jgi:hypothetical protein